MIVRIVYFTYAYIPPKKKSPPSGSRVQMPSDAADLSFIFVYNGAFLILYVLVKYIIMNDRFLAQIHCSFSIFVILVFK